MELCLPKPTLPTCLMLRSQNAGKLGIPALRWVGKEGMEMDIQTKELLIQRGPCSSLRRSPRCFRALVWSIRDGDEPRRVRSL